MILYESNLSSVDDISIILNILPADARTLINHYFSENFSDESGITSSSSGCETVIAQ